MAPVLALMVLAGGCSRRGTGTAYDDPPAPLKTVFFTMRAPLDRPARLAVVGDSLFVSFNGESLLGVFDLELNLARTIRLRAPEDILPTGFAVTDSSFVVCDHGRGLLAVFDRAGNLVTSFDRMPGGNRKLAPLAVAAVGGVAYVADMNLRRVLAVALNEQPGVTGRGELVLTIPRRGKGGLGLPSAVRVTPDGRVLVGDGLRGEVGVYTCNAERIYTFDAVPGTGRIAPQAFAWDGVRDPGGRTEEAFDPSGLGGQGRIHMLDGFNGRVHMFDPRGRYLASYPAGDRLQGPAGLAVHAPSGRIFVADPAAGCIRIFAVEGS